MTYCRVVFEIEVNEQTDNEILINMTEHINSCICISLSIDDVEIHEMPYIKNSGV